jgi:uncharacterized SAM-binding protein YcdF (DUF218 family)
LDESGMKKTLLWVLVLGVSLLTLQAAYFTSVYDHLPSAPGPAGLVLVYSGGKDRVSFASRWKETPNPPRFLFSGWDYQRTSLLKNLGLPEGRVLVEDQARTTDQNARFCSPMIRSLGIRQVLLALPWYHLPRALFLTRLYLLGSGISVSPFATSALPAGWWGNPHFRLEMVKFWGSLGRVLLSLLGITGWPPHYGP